MRCQRHQSSTSDDLTYACILEDETAHPRIAPHPPSPAGLPTPSPEELSDADTADLWAYLWMGGSDGRQVRATAEAGFFMDQYQLELKVHFGRRYEAFCNESPLHIDELMVLDCGYPEQSLDDVTGVSARERRTDPCAAIDTKHRFTMNWRLPACSKTGDLRLKKAGPRGTTLK